METVDADDDGIVEMYPPAPSISNELDEEAPELTCLVSLLLLPYGLVVEVVLRVRWPLPVVELCSFCCCGVEGDENEAIAFEVWSLLLLSVRSDGGAAEEYGGRTVVRSCCWLISTVGLGVVVSLGSLDK